MRLFAGAPAALSRGPGPEAAGRRARGGRRSLGTCVGGQGGAWSCQWSWSRSKIGLVDESSSTVVVVKSVVVVELWSLS